MIYVNGDWKVIRDLYEIVEIVRESYNDDLADELEKLIPDHTDEECYELECSVKDLEDENSALEEELSDKEAEIDRKDERIEELEDEINSLREELCK